MFLLGRIENIEGKGENAGYQDFLLVSQCFQEQPFTGLLKVRIVWYRVKSIADRFQNGNGSPNRICL